MQVVCVISNSLTALSAGSTIVEAKRFEVDYGKKPKLSLGDGRLDTPFTVSWLTMHVIEAQAWFSVSFSMHGSHWQRLVFWPAVAV